MKPFLRSQLERYAQRLGELDFLLSREDIDSVLEALSRGVAKKMLHGTLAELRNSDPTARAQTAHTASRLFLRSQGKKAI